MNQPPNNENFNFWRGFLIAAGVGLAFWALVVIVIFALYRKGIL